MCTTSDALCMWLMPGVIFVFQNDDLTNTTKVKPQEVVLRLRPGDDLMVIWNLTISNFTQFMSLSCEAKFGSVSYCVGQKRSFDISVRTPENYPVDVYMLMDMSFSMKDNLQSVETLGLDLGLF